MPSVSSQFDAGPVVQGAMQFAQSLDLAKASIENMVVSQIKFNNASKDGKFTAYVKAVVDGSKEVVIALKQTATGWEGTAAKVTESAAKIAAAQKKMTTPVVDKGSAVALVKDLAAAYGIQEQAIKNLVIADGKLKSTAAGQVYSTEIRAQVSATQQLVLQVQKLGNEYKVVAAQLKDIKKSPMPLLPTRASLRDKPPGGSGGDSGDSSFFNFDAGTVASVFLFKQALGAITQEIRTAASEAREFAISISQIRTLSQDSQSTFKDWDNTLMDVSNHLGLPIIDVAKAAYEALSNQVTRGADDTAKFITSVGQFARVTVSSLEESTNLFSSVINGYGMSLERTDEIAAKLFKTIDLGRVKASDLANSLGRVTPLANQLGISLEETLGAISTLTRQGVMPQNALTFFLNLMQKLVNPTEELKNLMESWGTPTAEAAIATFGFVGVLKKLEEQTKGSASEIAKFFNEIRGKQGFTGLTANGFYDQYTNDVKQIEQASVDYQNAVKIRAESSADTINKELNRVHNFFVSLGEQLTEALAYMNNKFATISGTIRVLTNAIGIAVVGFGAYKTVVAGAALYTALFSKATITATGATVADTLATEANAAAKSRLGRISAALGGPVGIIIGVATAVSLLVESLRDSKKEIEGIDETTQRLQDRLQRQGIKSQRSEGAKQFIDLKNNLKDPYAQRLQETARGIIGLKDGLLELKPVGEEVNQSLAASFKNYIDSLSRGINEYKRKIEEARTGIKNSAKEVQNFQASLQQIVRDTQYNYANDFQKNQLRGQFINQLRAEANSLYKTGNTDDQKLADQKLAEAAKLMKETFDAVQQGRKASLEDSIRRGETPADQNQIQVSTEELQTHLNDLMAQQAEGHRTVNELREKAIQDTQKQVDLEENRKKLIEQIAKDLDNLKIEDANGQIDKRFRDPTSGKFSQKMFDEYRARKADQLKGLGTPGTNDKELYREELENQSQYLDGLGRQAEFLKQEIDLRNKLTTATAAQAKIQAEQRDILRRFEENQSTRLKALEALQGNKGKFYDALGALDVLQTKARTFVPDGTDLKNSSVDARNRRAPLVETLEAQRTQLEQMVSQFRQTKPELISQRDIDTLKEMGSRYFQTYQQLLKEYNPKINDGNIGGVELIPRKGDNPERTFGDIKGAFSDIIKEAQDAFNVISAATKQNTQINYFGSLASDLGLLNDAAKDASKSGIPELGMSFEAVGGRIEQINLQLEIMARKITTLPRPDLNKIGDNLGNVVPGFDNGAPEFRAMGGIAGSHPGRPRGTDIVPAWLTPGEYIMPVDKTQRFKPQLDAMRAGINPRYYAGGGYVTTTVGDIHITVSGSDSPEKNVREIGKQLRRQVLRGQLKLI